MKLIIVLFAVLWSATALAQPYAPIKKAPGDLIKLRAYNRSPVRLADFKIIKTEEVLNGKRLDFQQTYDIPYWDLVESLEKANRARKPVSALDPELVPNAKNGELFIIGIGDTAGKKRITLGDFRSLPYKFTFDITSDDNGRAVVTVHSAIRSTPYGGSRPARAGFKPVGAKMVKFIWD